MIVEVELCGFEGGQSPELNVTPPGVIRKVDIPDKLISPELTTLALLEYVFLYGQNDMQPQSMVRSVSVGDIVRHNGNRYTVNSVGFNEVK